MKTFHDVLRLLARISLSLIFFYMTYDAITHWTGKLTEYKNLGIPQPSIVLFATSVVQFFGAVALVLGYKARWGALALAVFMALTIFYYHDFWNDKGAADTVKMLSFMRNAGILGGLLLIYADGPGSLTLGK